MNADLQFNYRDFITDLARHVRNEHVSSRRETLLLHEMTVEERVARGVCLSDLHPLPSLSKNRYAFRFPVQGCRIREGDWMVLSQGKPIGPEVARGLPVVVESLDPMKRVLELSVVGRQYDDIPIEGGIWTLDYTSSDRNAQRLATLILSKLPDSRALESLFSGEGWPFEPPFNHFLIENLDDSQSIAATEAIHNPVTLIHGPPGTGKTRVLSRIMTRLAESGHRILVSAFTHRAIDNLLESTASHNPDIPLIKLGRRSPDLSPAVQSVAVNRFPDSIPRGTIVGSTIYALMRLSDSHVFDTLFIDEASQLPVSHAVIPLLRARGAIICAGDHRQLPPVRRAESNTSPLAGSLFELLVNLYPARCFMLTRSYRLPKSLCTFPSSVFYDGKLRSEIPDDSFIHPPPDSRHPELSALWCLKSPMRTVWVNHEGYGAFSPPEAESIARLVHVLLSEMAVEPEDIAVVAPHRAQVREVTDRLWKHAGSHVASRVIIDTVERMQGQERDIIVVSLCASDGDFILDEADFILSPNRLNVSITRARRLLVVVGSRHFFRILPTKPEHIAPAALFRSFERKLLEHSIDITDSAYRWLDLIPPENRFE